MLATVQGTPTTLKDAMMRSDLIEIDAEVSRLAQSKSGHPSTGSAGSTHKATQESSYHGSPYSVSLHTGYLLH